jgi:hypothetical protein
LSEDVVVLWVASDERKGTMTLTDDPTGLPVDRALCGESKGIP